jgi:glycosyltransferase involved in cell wall biosynthesis
MHLLEEEHIPGNKLIMIYNGLSVERRTRPEGSDIELARRKIGAPPGAFVLVCVANFSPVKRHDILLNSFKRAKEHDNNLFLLLIGNGSLKEQIARLINELRLGEAVQIISSCSNPLPLLCASNAAILTSEIEGCSNALLEAMAMGLPIVATDVGGNSELVTQGLGGILCPSNDVGSLASALCRLAERPEMSMIMGLYNIDRVRRHFTDDIMIERTLALYQSVLTDISRLDAVEANVCSETF